MVRKLAAILVTFCFSTVLTHAQSVNDSTSNNDQTLKPPVVVDVWAPAATFRTTQSAPDALSRDFAQSALQAVKAMRDMQAKIAFAIEHGYPLSEFSIACERDQVADAVKSAELSAVSDADRAAVQELEVRNEILRDWTDWLIEAHQTMHLGNYYMTPSALESSELSQKLDHCSQSMTSMLVRRRVQEDYACR